ncbi:DEAD/DEAH box helicase family protein [Mesoplasma melaleucae]|uniref:DEAD/DEAH box helicase family protein n=1 Tax=Mesoplasma melaleucae TaxID=81459 RepID=UPI0004860F47|nr:DEAD/DEAH box helicase family protein [Mesoplasma melaleucae]
MQKDFKERVEVRIKNSFKNNGSRIHMKAYCFLREGGFSNLYIGSNNFTRTGIMIGNEYSIKINEFREKEIFNNFILEFNNLWKQDLIEITDSEIINKMILSQIFIDEINRQKEKEQFEIINNLSKNKDIFELFDYQKEVINRINQREKDGINKHLIVMATDTGKTLTIAKYFEELFYKTNKPLKILFLAHQKEILEQGITTFEKIITGFKSEVCDFYDQRNKIEDFESNSYIFATFQSLSKNLKFIQEIKFDLVILDEVHHIQAKNYKKVFDLVSKNSKTLIGLTATPERTDGIDINKYFNYEYAYELSLYNALSNDLLAPFDYYFIQDKTVDLTGIELNKSEKLWKILSSQQRNKFILENIEKMIGLNNRDTSTVLFCSSIEHANKLKKFLCENNLRCEVLTSENNSKERENLI